MTERYYAKLTGKGAGDVVELDEHESHHLRRVMRLGVGDIVRVFGEWREFEGEVVSLGRRVQIQLRQAREPLPCLDVRLGAAVPWLRGGRTDELLQRLTELGVERLIVFRAERCVAQAKADKLARLERLLIESCKQCERADIPALQLVGSLEEAVGLLHDEGFHVLFAGERTAGPRLSQVVQTVLKENQTKDERPSLALVTGPEGGWSPRELEFALAHTTVVSLGPRILRAEVAPVVGIIGILVAVEEL